MVFKGLLCALLALRILCHVAALDLTKSNWITFGPRDVVGGVIHDFRLDLTSPAGKTAVSAQIIITCDDECDIWFGSEYISSQTDWKTSDSFCVQASAARNVVAVRVKNEGIDPNASAFIATLQIIYSDGSSDIFVTDTSWRANDFTDGFQAVDFDDSAWPHANIVGAANDPPWNLPAPPESPSTVSLIEATWIWTAEIPQGQPDSNTPVGSRAFRKTFTLPGGSMASSGGISIVADDHYLLYVQGKQVGVTSSGSSIAQRWQFELKPPASEIIIAVEAANAGAYAGLIATVAFESTVGSCSATIFGSTDLTWQYSTEVKPGFEKPGFDVSSWPFVAEEGPYGEPPWYWIAITDAN